MSDILHCWNCGAELVALILPMSRREECPACSADQHVCMLCCHYDPAIANACREDRAEQVTDKTRANFCDYFEPQAGAFKASATGREAEAKAQLAALFGDDISAPDKTEIKTGDAALDALAALFNDKDK